MKNKYIYILITIVCFFTFSSSVEATYKEVCQYSQKYETPNQVDCKNPETNIIIYYDSSNEKTPYKVEEKRICGDNYDSYTTSYDVKKIKTKSNLASWGGLGGKELYFTSQFSGNSCPSNVLFSKYNANFICFYNDENGKNWCTAKSNNSTDNYEIDEKNYAIGNKVNISLGNYTNIKDGATCEKYIALGGANTSECYVKFEYKNGQLVISSSSKGNSANGEIKEVTESSFECGVFSSTVGSNIKTVNLTLEHGNYSNTDIVIASRAEFDKKYLEEWNNNKSCPSLYYDPLNSTKTTRSDGTIEHRYFLMFDDAYEDIEENGNPTLDIDSIVELKDWNYDWNSWFGNKTEYNSCDGLLGDDLIGLINDILLYIRILVPVVLIGLGISDFVKAVISVNDDAMVKARNKFLKRLIMAVAVFIIPSLVSFLLETLDGIWAYLQNNTCSIWD